MVPSLRFISSEAPIPHDEYSQLLDSVFGVSKFGKKVFAGHGLSSSLKILSKVVYPVPTIQDFFWFLRHTKPIALSDGFEIICVAEKFVLDEYAKFDWIRAELSPTVVLAPDVMDDLLGYVAHATFYKCLRYQWDKFDQDMP